MLTPLLDSLELTGEVTRGRGVIAGRRAFVIVLDACGAGALPDAAEYGDAGTNTLRHVGEAEGGLDVPTLARLGLGQRDRDPGRGARRRPGGARPARAARARQGHDDRALGADGRGRAARARVPGRASRPRWSRRSRAATGRDGALQRAARGAARARGVRRASTCETGALILYTSQDSVFQLAAHVDVVGEEELYAHCATAREILHGEHAVGRVIARPFRGEPGAFERTPGRRDFALDPPARTYLDELAERGCEVHAVGKVGQVFNGRGDRRRPLRAGQRRRHRR